MKSIAIFIYISPLVLLGQHDFDIQYNPVNEHFYKNEISLFRTISLLERKDSLPIQEPTYISPLPQKHDDTLTWEDEGLSVSVIKKTTPKNDDMDSVVSKIICYYLGSPVKVPLESYMDLYDPLFKSFGIPEIGVYKGGDNRFYIKIMSSNTGYEAILIFDNLTYVGRVYDTDI
jgi:hypothetical protein